MKGQHSLFTQFFPAKTTTELPSKQRPRNFFMPERNELLVHRYYFYVEIKGYRYERCLEELEKDLFITSNRQIAVLNECSVLLGEVMHKKPSLRDLAKKFPRLNWKL